MEVGTGIGKAANRHAHGDGGVAGWEVCALFVHTGVILRGPSPRSTTPVTDGVPYFRSLTL